MLTNKKTRKAVNNRQPKNNSNIVRSSAPVSKGSVVRNSIPSLRMVNGVTKIRHSEFITNLAGTQGLDFATVWGNRVNPGRSAMFPWLAPIARQYESYRFKNLVFRYESLSSTAIPGFAGITIDYDPTDPAPVTKQAFLAMQSAVRGSVWESFKHISTSANLAKRSTYFVATDETIYDPELYDVGFLSVATGGQQAQGSVGELWVDYDVELMTPQMSVQFGGAQFSASTGVSYSNPLGTAPVVSLYGVDLTVDNTGRVKFNQAWEGLMVVQCYCSSGITSTSTMNITSPLGTISFKSTKGGTLSYPNYDSNMITYVVQIQSSPGSSFQLACTGTPVVSNTALTLSSLSYSA